VKIDVLTSGLPGGGGGLSDAVVVSREAVLPLPENIDLDVGGEANGSSVRDHC